MKLQLISKQHLNFVNILKTLGIEPGTSGGGARALPMCYAPPPPIGESYLCPAVSEYIFLSRPVKSRSNMDSVNQSSSSNFYFDVSFAIKVLVLPFLSNLLGSIHFKAQLFVHEAYFYILLPMTRPGGHK